MVGEQEFKAHAYNWRCLSVNMVAVKVIFWSRQCLVDVLRLEILDSPQEQSTLLNFKSFVVKSSFKASTGQFFEFETSVKFEFNNF